MFILLLRLERNQTPCGPVTMTSLFNILIMFFSSAKGALFTNLMSCSENFKNNDVSGFFRFAFGEKDSNIFRLSGFVDDQSNFMCHL